MFLRGVFKAVLERVCVFKDVFLRVCFQWALFKMCCQGVFLRLCLKFLTNRAYVSWVNDCFIIFIYDIYQHVGLQYALMTLFKSI